MLKETEALLILNAVPGLTARRIRSLMSCLGDAAGVLRSPRHDLAATGILTNRVIENILTFDRDNFLRTEMRLIREHGVELISCRDSLYPSSLAEISDAPVILYVKGRLQPVDRPVLAFVGSRRASVYGTGVAREWSARLAEMGFVIVSGLARGIDTAAHRGCLRGGGNSYAVTGCGLAQAYPFENSDLMAALAGNGAVLSEFPMTVPPLPRNFPQRNRIISGLSLGVFVVEAGRRSGALITSRYALEQGREVFALPGRIKDMNSWGTHQLIQQGAKLVTCVGDILEEIQPVLMQDLPSAGRGAALQADAPAGSWEERIILEALDRPVGIDDLIPRVGRPLTDVMRLLFSLQMRHKVKRLPGMMFERM